MKNIRFSVHNKRGFGLIEVVVSIGILSVMMAATASMFTMLYNENKAITDKLAIIDFQRNVTLALSSKTICSTFFEPANLENSASMPFDPQKVDKTNPLVISLKSLPVAISAQSNRSPASVVQKASTLSENLIIQPNTGIQLIVENSAPPLSAKLRINFDQTKLRRQLKGLEFPLFLTTTGPANAKSVTGCGIDDGSTGKMDWIQVPGGWTIYSNQQNGQSWLGWPNGNGKSPMQICVDAGFTNYTGSCKVESTGNYGSVIANFTSGYWSIGCFAGSQNANSDMKILCAN